MEKSRFKKKRQPPPHRREGMPKPQMRPGTIPQFLKPCKVLIRNMKPIIAEKAEKSEKKLLVDLIRSQLRKTIALMLENQDYMPSVQIVKLYREYYPKSTDFEVVIRNLEQLRAGHWPVTNNPGYSNPQSKSGADKNKTNTKPQAKSEKTGTPTTPVTNIKQQPKENIITKKDSKVQEVSLAQDKSNVQQGSSAGECSNIQQLSFSQKNSKTQEDSKVQQDLKIEVVPKPEIKNDHKQTNSTVDPLMMENDDDDWVEYGLDSEEEDSQESSMNPE